VRVKTFFPSGPLGTTADLVRAHASYWPVSLYQFASSIASHSIAPDIAVIKVTPPRDGSRSVAFHGDYAIELLKASPALILEECPQAPWLGAHLPVDSPNVIGMVSEPAGRARVTEAEVQPGDIIRQIAQSVTSVVPADATVQLGMGAWTRAVAAELGRLGVCQIHTGLAGPWLIDLLEGLGKSRDLAVTTSVVANDPRLTPVVERLYAERKLRLETATLTHHPTTLAGLHRFVAINSAWEVDLLGQVNCEYLISREGVRRRGIGGLWDFANAASGSPDGLSVVALPASSQLSSRVVPVLRSPRVSLPGNLVDMIVTEFGVADLRGKDVDERITAIANVAAPNERTRLLRQAWRLGIGDTQLPEEASQSVDAHPLGHQSQPRTEEG
jgi:acetyl-CoA hydrolase